MHRLRVYAQMQERGCKERENEKEKDVREKESRRERERKKRTRVKEKAGERVREVLDTVMSMY